jgi:hypothetical protein
MIFRSSHLGLLNFSILDLMDGLAFKNKYIAHAPKMIYTHARCSHNVHMLPARQDSMIQAAIEKLPKASGEEAGEAGEAGEDEAMDLLEGEEEDEVDDVEEG